MVKAKELRDQSPEELKALYQESYFNFATR
jgi:ribosomal protein L29